MSWRVKDLSYEEKLKKCGLTTLQRRSRGDLLEAYKTSLERKLYSGRVSTVGEVRYISTEQGYSWTHAGISYLRNRREL